MKRVTRSLGVISGVAVLLILLTMTAGASQTRPNTDPRLPGQPIAPAAPAPTGLTASITSTAAEQEAIRQMWTRERRISAPGLDRMLDTGPTMAPAYRVDPTALGLPGMTRGGEPQAGAAEIARAAYAADWEAEDLAVEAVVEGGLDAAQLLDGPAAETGTSQLFTRHPVNRYTPFWKEQPYRKIGRLFFNTPNGASSCSASVISPYNIIVTAAHCLYDSTYNRWYSGWAFAPAYRDGSAPYGVFPYYRCRVLYAWMNLSGNFSINSWSRHDIGVCTMSTNSAGQGLSNTVGWLGRSWNNLYTQLYHTFGYPSNLDSSRYLTLCISESFAQTTEVVGTGCDMTFGSSGGPLIRGFVPFTGGLSNFVNSVVSGGYSGVYNTYGPRFNSVNIVPLCNEEGC